MNYKYSYWAGGAQINAVISAWKGKRREIINNELFGLSDLFEIVNIYKKTEYIFDQFARTTGGIHSGSDGSSKWVLNEGNILQVQYSKK